MYWTLFLFPLTKKLWNPKNWSTQCTHILHLTIFNKHFSRKTFIIICLFRFPCNFPIHHNLPLLYTKSMCGNISFVSSSSSLSLYSFFLKFLIHPTSSKTCGILALSVNQALSFIMCESYFWNPNFKPFHFILALIIIFLFKSKYKFMNTGFKINIRANPNPKLYLMNAIKIILYECFQIFCSF